MPDGTPDLAAVHHAIMRRIVDIGHAPDLGELAALLGCSREAARTGLRRLADAHGVVLHPDGVRVWAAHPFSLAPTGVSVHRGGDAWWGNCVWCAFGIAGLLGGAVTIATAIGGRDRQVTLHVEDGAVAESGLFVHFPVPMRQVWDNVIYACSTMLVFDDEADIDRWCRRTGIAKGDIRPLPVVAGFAREWYAPYLDENWRKRSTVEARALFARHGLDGPIWDLPADGERF